MSDHWNHQSDKTPILLHPGKRKELFEKGQTLFNDELFFEAHEAWEELWHLEQGRDKGFIQALILVAAHFHHVRRQNWSGAESTGASAREKLRVPPANRLYSAIDTVPLVAALDYNGGLLEGMNYGDAVPATDAFLTPKVFEKD